VKIRPLLWMLLVAGLVVVPACDKASPVAPAGTTITLSVNPTRIETSGNATVTAIVRRENGSPVNPGTIVNFSTTLGKLDPSDAPTNDNGVAETRLVGAGQIGTATVTASTGAAAAATAELQIGSLASSVTLVASPTAIGQAGGTVDLLAVVRDDAGQLLQNLAVNFSTTAGTLDSRGAPLLTNERGEVRDVLKVKEIDIIALTDASITVSAFAATAEGEQLLETTTDIAVRGLVSFISLQVTPGSVAPAGGTLSLLALVKDDVGLGVSGAPVNFTTEAGSLDSGGAVVPADGNGQARDTLIVTAQDVDALGSRTFNVRAETVDFSGAPIEASFRINVQTGAPIADFTWSASGTLVTFLFAGSGDPVLRCTWTFGDGETESQDSCDNTEHRYGTGGTKQVTLQVTNDLGTDSIQKPVEVPER
jgi:hypothetical protein